MGRKEACRVSVPGPHTIFGRVQVEMPHSVLMLLSPSPCHTGSQRSGRSTGRASARRPPANRAPAEPSWSRARPRCPARHSRPAVGTLPPEPCCHMFPARVCPVRRGPWTRSFAGHACEFKRHGSPPPSAPQDVFPRFPLSLSPVVWEAVKRQSDITLKTGSLSTRV